MQPSPQIEPLLCVPELGVPIPDHIPYLDLRVRAEMACNTAEELIKHGLKVEFLEEDFATAATLATAYAEDPEGVSMKVTNPRAATLTPASLILVGNLLKDFGQVVAQSALQIRHLVTNKLLIESDNPDPRVRLRALELLGKISDVGLFAEKSEITITHQSTSDLKNRLREKLLALSAPVGTEITTDPIEEAEFVEVP